MKRRVHFADYQVTLEAEVKEVGPTLVVITEPEQIKDFGKDEPQLGDIVLRRPTQAENEYNHWDRIQGIFVLRYDFWSVQTSVGEPS